MFLLALQLEKDNYSRLFALWKDGIPAVKDKYLMWCTAMGGLRFLGRNLGVNSARIL